MSTARDASILRYWDVHPHGTQFAASIRLEDDPRAYFDAIRPYMDCYRFPEVMAEIEAEAAVLRGRHLLEIGCGLGYDAIEFLRRGVKVTATDLTSANVELAARHLELEGLKAEEIRVASVLELPFADKSFDAVYMNGVLQHIAEPEPAVREIHRVLRPGGRMILSHHYRRPSLFHLLSRLSSGNVISIEGEAPPVTHFFAEAELRALCRGFRLERLVRQHYRLIPAIRPGWKAAAYSRIFVPLYNLLPAPLARAFANKMTVVAIREA